MVFFSFPIWYNICAVWLCGRGKGEGVSGTDLEYNNIAELKFQIENLTYTL